MKPDVGIKSGLVFANIAEKVAKEVLN